MVDDLQSNENGFNRMTSQPIISRLRSGTAKLAGRFGGAASPKEKLDMTH